jgi:hypothetical protein
MNGCGIPINDGRVTSLQMMISATAEILHHEKVKPVKMSLSHITMPLNLIISIEIRTTHYIYYL